MGKVIMSGIVPPVEIPLHLPPIGKALNDCTWEEISNIAKKGKARQYFNIGDTKAITIKGTVGTQAIDTTLYAYIIGFDHNGATNTIDFGTFKSEASGGKDLAFKDGKYNNYSTGGTLYYNMNHSSNTNKGGWKDCDLRYDILGSTHAKGVDANETCTVSPVANTLMAALPVELRAVMKPMTIYTDNTAGGAGSVLSNITTTVDYLPLPSPWEVLTSTQAVGGNSYEKNYQTQYEYFKSGNSAQKYRFGASSNTCIWWTRSPVPSDSKYFKYISASGTNGDNEARYSYGIAPIFRV